MSENNVMIKKDAETEKYLSFYSTDVEYAVNIKYVTDIINLLPITFLPKIPKYIKGIVNLRGKIIPVIDIRMRFGKETIDYTESACIIVMEYSDITVGILVDAVAEVSDIETASIMTPPKSNSTDASRFVSGISQKNNKVKLIINSMSLFEVE
jgi:purine-binding chemotaxis protein CheW